MGSNNNNNENEDDHDLRRRFANLSPKPSTVSSTDGDLNARFEKLFNKKAVAAQNNVDAVSTSKDDIDVDESNDDIALEDILGELGTHDQGWLLDANATLLQNTQDAKLGTEDVNDIQRLLREVRPLIKEDKTSELSNDKSQEDDAEDTSTIKPEHFTQADEKEVDDMLAQVMEEIRLSKLSEEHDNGSDLDDDSSNDKCAKQDNPEDNIATGGSGDDDDGDDLMRRFAALERLKLPPAPSSIPSGELGLPLAPTNKPSKPGQKVSIEKKIDDMMEDSEHWCCVCNEDATFRCLGCDGDLYCTECFNEGHRGPGAGLDEKNHKFIKYTRGR